MTIEQKYEAYLHDLWEEQQARPTYGDLDWYAHTGDLKKFNEVWKYGTPIPTLEQFKERLEDPEKVDYHTEFLTNRIRYVIM